MCLAVIATIISIFVVWIVLTYYLTTTKEQQQEPAPNQPAPVLNQPTPNRLDAAAPQNQERQQKDDKENRAPKPPSLPKNYRIPKFKSGDDRLVNRARRRAMQANKLGKGVAAGRPPLLVSAMQALGEAMDASVAQAVLRPEQQSTKAPSGDVAGTT